MPDTRMKSWQHTDAQDDVLVIAGYANIGIGPAVVFDGGAFMVAEDLRGFARDLLTAADWLAAEVAPKHKHRRRQNEGRADG